MKANGLRDVVFAWRGTVAQSEWHMDIMDKQIDYDAENYPDVKMAEGFCTMYTECGTGRDPPQVCICLICWLAAGLTD